MQGAEITCDLGEREEGGERAPHPYFLGNARNAPNLPLSILFIESCSVRCRGDWTYCWWELGIWKAVSGGRQSQLLLVFILDRKCSNTISP